MSYAEAIAELNDQFAQGDIDSDTYAAYRAAIEYEHGEKMSAMERQGVTA